MLVGQVSRLPAPGRFTTMRGLESATSRCDAGGISCRILHLKTRGLLMRIRFHGSFRIH